MTTTSPVNVVRRTAQAAHVADVEEVEAAVGEDDAFAGQGGLQHDPRLSFLDAADDGGAYKGWGLTTGLRVSW